MNGERPRQLTALAAWATTAVVALVVAAAPVRAETINSADRTAIQALIVSQVAAFARDDGAAAYALASPATHVTFPTAEAFMAMIRRDLMPIYRPRTVVFGPLVDGPYGPMQVVFVIGSDGVSYVATYSVDRQADGSWAISGCVVVLNNSPRI